MVIPKPEHGQPGEVGKRGEVAYLVIPKPEPGQVDGVFQSSEIRDASS